MTNENQPSQTQETPNQNQVNEIDNMSFSDYEKMRKGIHVEAKAKPEPVKTEQKKATESETVETDESEDESENDSDESVKDKPKKKGGFQKRIDKLNAQKAAALQEAEYWKSLASKKDAGETKQDKAESLKADGEPSPDDFETHSEYVKALTKWEIKQEKLASEEETKKSSLAKEFEEKRKSHFEREKSFSEKTEDYKEVIVELMESNPKVSVTFENLLIESDHGPEILYLLAKDPEEFERINSLSPLAIAREFGKLEAKISSKPSPEKQEIKKITKAPKPIEPVGNASTGSIKKSIDDPDLPFSDYERMRREQMKRR